MLLHTRTVLHAYIYFGYLSLLSTHVHKKSYHYFENIHFLPTMTTLADHVLVLYASQTGNAEYIAKNVDAQAKERGFVSTCFMLDDYEKVAALVPLLSCRV